MRPGDLYRCLMRSLITSESGDRAGVVRVVDAPVSPSRPRSSATCRVGRREATWPPRRRSTPSTWRRPARVRHLRRPGRRPTARRPRRGSGADCRRRAHRAVSPTPHQRRRAGTGDRRERRRGHHDGGRARAARRRLRRRRRRRSSVIPHGASRARPEDAPMPGRRPLILTWGLLGPGKGIEWAIDGLQTAATAAPAARVHRCRPDPPPGS